MGHNKAGKAVTLCTRPEDTRHMSCQFPRIAVGSQKESCSKRSHTGNEVFPNEDARLFRELPKQGSVLGTRRCIFHGRSLLIEIDPPFAVMLAMTSAYVRLPSVSTICRACVRACPMRHAFIAVYPNARVHELIRTD